MGFVIRATGGRVILIHVAKQNGYESCLLFSPEERSVKNVSKENARGMQDDTISREQAIGAVRATLLAWSFMPEWRDNKIIEAVEQLPTIQPKRGRWIGKYPVASVCSECGFLIHDSKVKAFAYCPNCGADMRGDSDE